MQANNIVYSKPSKTIKQCKFYAFQEPPVFKRSTSIVSVLLYNYLLSLNLKTETGVFLRTLLNAIEQESEILFFMLNMCTKIGDIKMEQCSQFKACMCVYQ